MGDDQSPFARQLLQLMERLGEKYEIEELASQYAFTGSTPLTVPQAIAIKEELEQIDRLLQQLEEARETAQIGLIDLEALAEFTEPGDLESLRALQQAVQDYLRELAEQQGLERDGNAYQLTPKAYQLFQGRLLERIFSQLQACAHRTARGGRAGRGSGGIAPDQAVRVRRFAGQHGYSPDPDQCHAQVRDRTASAVEDGRHRGPSDSAHSQVCDRGDHGHERVDALRRPVHQRQTDGPGPGWPDSSGIPGR